MFDILSEAFESSMITWTLYRCSKGRRKNLPASVITASCMFAADLVIRQYSSSEILYELLRFIIGYLYLSRISDMDKNEKLFFALLLLTLAEVMNLWLCSSISYYLYKTVNFARMLQVYYVPAVLLQHVFHAGCFCWIADYTKKHDFTMTSEEYRISSWFLLTTGFITICLEETMLHNTNGGLYMLLGVYALFLLIIIFLYLINIICRRSAEEEHAEMSKAIIKSQISSNNRILEARQELMQMRHDMKHILQASGNAQSQEIKNLMKRYSESTAQEPVPFATKSSAINYVLNVKRDEALQKSIDFQCILNFTRMPEIEDSDLCLLLSNLLDNAIVHIGIGKRINVTIKNINEMMIIIVENSINGTVLNDNGEFITTLRNDEHGYGVSTIRQIAEKYHGSLTYMQDGEMLQAVAALPL